MLQVNHLNLPVGADEALLLRRTAKALGVRPGDIISLSLHRQSIDARKKSDIHLVCTVRASLADEASILRRTPKGVAHVSDTP